uniref:lysozyme n=1 Tax=Timema californicum TaxID=61474 RepID=A0A7R9J1Z0_TIMCA|nr:unnamed protein product [Timema californicum]
MVSVLAQAQQQQQLVQGETKPVNDLCLGCICEAVSNCNRSFTCAGDVCGLFRITWAYWSDAGKPVLQQDHPDNQDAYVRCVTDPFCAARAVQGYMTKFSKPEFQSNIQPGSPIAKMEPGSLAAVAFGTRVPSVCTKDYGSIPGDRNAGSILGDRNSGSIPGDRNAGSILGDKNSGSILGDRNSGFIIGDRNSGSILCDRNSGSILGDRNSGSILSDRNFGSILGDRNSGSIPCDRNFGSILGDRNSGSIPGDMNSGSILVDRNFGSILGDRNSGYIPADRNSGSNLSDRDSSSIPADRDSGSISADRSSGDRNSGSIPFDRNSGSIPPDRGSGSIPADRDSGSIPADRDSGSILGDMDSLCPSITLSHQCSDNNNIVFCRVSQDCNGDGRVDCFDYAAIHRLGGYGCNGALDFNYQNKFQQCQAQVALLSQG